MRNQRLENYFTIFNQLLDIYFPTLKEIERWLLWAALCRTDFNQIQAGELLGASPRAISYKMNNLRKFYQDHPKIVSSIEEELGHENKQTWNRFD